jgi:Flp pilus assembly protein TadG
MALDIGHLYVVRNELQNAADAAAMAGAAALYPNTPPTTPNWTAAEASASAAIQFNKSDGTTLNNCQVQTGYWNLSRTPYGLQSQSITPGTLDAPAVKVTVSRSGGNNGGPVTAFFASVLGIKSFSMGTQATAVVDSPASVGPGALLPLAIGAAVAAQAGSYNSPATTIKIGSDYHYPTSQAGQWTSFTVDSDNVSTIRDLLASGNPTSLSIGENIWIEPGTKTTLYGSVPVGVDVLLPIVTNIDTHEASPIVGFIGFHITASVGGSGKYIEGYFLSNIYAPLSLSIGGPAYGAYSPPRLVN